MKILNFFFFEGRLLVLFIRVEGVDVDVMLGELLLDIVEDEGGCVGG